MKKAASLLFASSLLLTGCGIEADTAHKIPAQVIDDSKYEEQDGEGVFLGVFNKKFVDIEVGGERKMFNLPKEAKEKAEALEERTRVSFTFVLTRNNELELRDIVRLGKKVVKTEPNKDEPTEKKEPDDVKSDTLLSYYEVNLPEGYSIEGDNKVKNATSSIEVEDDLAETIQKERWRAAGILKPLGDMKEVQVNGEGFAFYVITNGMRKEVRVTSLGGKLLRVNMEYAEGSSDQENIRSILESIH